MSANPIPWSAARELKLRRKIVQAWLGVWICILSGMLLAIYSEVAKHPAVLLVAAGLWGLGIFLVYDLQTLRAELGEEMCRLPGGGFHEGSGMLANKPRQTANLTKWIQWADAPCDERSLFFHCNGCGKLHQWADAQWIPNFDGDVEDFEPGSRSFQIDPGGGRYVILCPCGLGHYKLKA